MTVLNKMHLLILSLVLCLPATLARCQRRGRYRSDGRFFIDDYRVNEVVSQLQRQNGEAFGVLVNETCEWRGESPMCGKDVATYGTIRWGWELVAYDEDVDFNEMCKNANHEHFPGVECCSVYGVTCLYGYKRLWCDTKEWHKSHSI
ncbi:hypothetical protein CDD81_7157 [Ophiocordyceps australis]|uniref:Uncharacterized protein n=1 Tax=Ophiocordyceps australis TaxID=1399860 RepID=A0A2C5XH52_9HYPO|nr:hypothetical protein CDD81_7157 [Ophiocordyceps australis]